MASFNFPDFPTLNQQVTGPGGQLYEWDGEKWIGIGGGGGGGGPFAPLINPPSGQNNYSPYDLDGGMY